MGAEMEGELSPLVDLQESEVFNTIPGERRGSLIARTPPDEGRVGERRGSLLDTPYLTAGSPTGSESVDVVVQRLGKELKVRLDRIEMPRPPTPIPPTAQSLSLSPKVAEREESFNLMPPPGDMAPSSSAVSSVRQADDGSSDSTSLLSDGDLGDESSVLSGGKIPPPNKRKRGRPETTGHYAQFKQRKKEEAEFELEERERREEAQILDENLRLKFGKNLPSLEDLMEEMTHLGTPDITAETMDYVLTEWRELRRYPPNSKARGRKP